MKHKKLINTIKNKSNQDTPIWLMRQAGRYLPEYRKIRNRTDSFLDLCYQSKLASEVTLQPLKRFDLDAAIIFADILLISDALGVKVKFIKGEGPILDKKYLNENLQNLSFNDENLKNVYETVSIVKNLLPKNVSLIGFAGSPWTVASYMIAGKSPIKSKETLKWINDNDKLSLLVKVLTHNTIQYLQNQISSGAEVIQLFDSWAGLLDDNGFNKWCIQPTKKIVTELKKTNPQISIIGFPRNVSIEKSLKYFSETGVDCISLDYNISINDAKKIQIHGPVQGNLNPTTLLNGGESLKEDTLEILNNLGEKPHIFNLGHGILPETPIENVSLLVDMVKNFKHE